MTTKSKAIRLLLCGLLILSVGLLSACSDGSETKSAGKKVTISATPPASGCGSYTAKSPADPDGVIKEINNKEYTEGLTGYPVPVRKSSYSDWKPKGDPPYTVGIVWNQM